MSTLKEKALWTTVLLLAAVTAGQTYLAAAAARERRPADLVDLLLDPRFDPFDGFDLTMSADELRTRVEELDDKVVVAFKTPGDKKASVKVSVEGGVIRARCELADGRSVRRIERMMSVPPEADPKTGRIEAADGEVRVVFARKPAEGPRA